MRAFWTRPSDYDPAGYPITRDLIVAQKDNFSPLEHYDTLGYIIVVLSIIGIFLLFRVDREIVGKGAEPIAVTDEPVMVE